VAVEMTANCTSSIVPIDGPEQLRIGKHVLSSRLIVGTGKYDTLELMKDSLEASGSDCVTVAVRREKLYDRNGVNIIDFIDFNRYTLFPNTAGCYNATDAVRIA